VKNRPIASARTAIAVSEPAAMMVGSTFRTNAPVNTTATVRIITKFVFIRAPLDALRYIDFMGIIYTYENTDG